MKDTFFKNAVQRLRQQRRGFNPRQQSDQFIAWLCGENVPFPYCQADPPKISKAKYD